MNNNNDIDMMISTTSRITTAQTTYDENNVNVYERQHRYQR